MQFNRFCLRVAVAVLGLFCLLQSGWAVEPFTVRDIRVEGLQRVEPGTVFASFPVRVGDTYTDDKGVAGIRALFALGLFKDVRVDVLGDVLVLLVEERPVVAMVEFVGTKEFDKDLLKTAMKDVGLAEGRPFDKALLDRAEQELKRQYINRSLYAAEVVTTVTPLERNRVNLTFTVSEGESAHITDIQIVGAKAFSESTLRKQMDLDTGNWMSWYTKSNRYSRAKLNGDLETLRSYYLARGYLEFRIESTQVNIAPNKQDVGIVINVVEGERFVVAGIKFDGNYLGREEEFKSLVTIEPGKAYNGDQVTATVKAFTDYFAKFGFAFAKVESRPDIDRATNRVVLTLRAEPQRRAYVHRVNVGGNNRTRDEVVRRELRQLESAWYDGDKIKLSRNRVDRLGYFKDVTVETNDVPGSADQVDLNFNVVEKPTGSLTLGMGISSSDGIGLSVGVSQQNAFGSGNSLGLQVNTSKLNRTVVLNTVDPYFTQDGVSRIIDLYFRTSMPYLDPDSYSLQTTGTSLRFGIPMTERDTVYLGVGVERTTINSGTYLPTTYQTYATQFGYTSTGVPMTIGWARDDRDSALAPSSGSVQRATGEVSMLGEVHYMRTMLGYTQYVPLTRQYTFMFNSDFAWGQGIDGRPYPLFKNFFGGGIGSVRGYEPGSLGPVDQTTNFPLGGTKKINFNAELQAPFPGTGNDRTLRVYGFVDAGNIFGEYEPMDLSTLRSSIGAGISWSSPMGPMRLAFARPLRSYDNDRIQYLQFQIGTTF